MDFINLYLNLFTGLESFKGSRKKGATKPPMTWKSKPNKIKKIRKITKKSRNKKNNEYDDNKHHNDSGYCNDCDNSYDDNYEYYDDNIFYDYSDHHPYLPINPLINPLINQPIQKIIVVPQYITQPIVQESEIQQPMNMFNGNRVVSDSNYNNYNEQLDQQINKPNESFYQEPYTLNIGLNTILLILFIIGLFTIIYLKKIEK